MTIYATFERGAGAGITGAARRAVAGIKKAMASISEGGVTLPAWFLACVTAAFLAGTATVIGVAWSTSQTVATDHTTIERHENRIQALEDMKVDVATLKADVSAIRDTSDRTEVKVDKLVDRELGRGRPRE